MQVMTEPRKGLAGVWDRLIGPGAAPSENILILVSSIIGAAGAATPFVFAGASLGLTAIAALIGLDVIGGAVANSTDATKRWYHRPSVSFAQHFGFLAAHLIHITLVACLFRGPSFDVQYLLVIGGVLLVTGLLVLVSPRFLKRPVATGLYLIGVVAALYVVGLTPGLEWFVPALLLKLLIGHFVPEAPLPRNPI